MKWVNKIMEEVYSVKPVGVKYNCDFCKKGEMLPTGKNVWSTEPPQFEHECTHCYAKILFDEKYPLIRYALVTE